MVNIDKIKAIAKQKGVKLGYLCDLLGEDQNYFNKVKKGLRRMDDNRISYLAEKLGTTFAYLTDGSDNPLPASRRFPAFNYDRYNERRIARHLTPDYSEAQLHLPENYWEEVRDGYLTPDEQTVTKLAVLLNTTYEYLMGLTDNPEIPHDDKTGVKIAVFGDVAAGFPINQIENFDPEDPNSWEEIDRSLAKGGIYFALRIKGDSMAPRILDGDVVIVRHQSTAESGQIAIVAVNGNLATCKKAFWNDNGDLSLVSLNPNYPPYQFTAEQVRKKPVTILGVVVELRGKF